MKWSKGETKHFSEWLYKVMTTTLLKVRTHKDTIIIALITKLLAF